MANFIFMLMLQYVVSTKAGMVNHVQGDVSVQLTESAAAGVPITTGTDGYAEILLNPGSFLRLGPDSAAVFDDVDLGHIVVRAVSGVSIVEVNELEDDSPITVSSGNLTVQIVQPGLYRFADGTASVLSGKAQVENSKLAYKKGWTILNPVGGIRAMKIAQNTPTPLDSWSKSRSAVISAANSEMVKTYTDRSVPIFAQTRSAWIWVPRIGVWTFVPFGAMNSPYGYRYQSYREALRRQQEQNSYNTVETSSGGARTPQNPAPSNQAAQPAPPPQRVSQEEMLNRKTPEIEFGNAP
jgi:hypothetical protein